MLVESLIIIISSIRVEITRWLFQRTVYNFIFW